MKKQYQLIENYNDKQRQREKTKITVRKAVESKNKSFKKRII